MKYFLETKDGTILEWFSVVYSDRNSIGSPTFYAAENERKRVDQTVNYLNTYISSKDFLYMEKIFLRTDLSIDGRIMPFDNMFLTKIHETDICCKDIKYIWEEE